MGMFRWKTELQLANWTRAQIIELMIGPNGASAFESPVDAQVLWGDLQQKLSLEFALRWYAAGGERKRFSEIADAYAAKVAGGEIPACKTVQLACQRHVADLARDGWAYRFDRAKADRVCRLAELLPHVKGKWAANAELIVLQPWQIFILCSIFGWVKVSTGTRRFSLAYIEVGRKNAKSILAAIIGLYMFACDGEFGAEVYSGATTEHQAMEVFRPAAQMMGRSKELAQQIGLDYPPAAKKLFIPENGSRFEAVVRDPGDGASPHCGIVDEYHEHDSDALFDTFRTGMGAREQPLQLVITTAGFNTAGPCMLLHHDVARMLEGSERREEVFAIIYTLDAADDWTSDAALIKANPNYGVSVFADFLHAEQAAAIQVARKQGVFKTKHLCVWVGASAAFFNLQKWNELGDPELRPEKFIGDLSVVSVDLATKRDIVARLLAFRRVIAAKDHYFLFGTFYLPAAEAMSPEKQHYQGWVRDGFLKSTPGAVIDFDLVMQETIEAVRTYRAREFAFDPWNAAQFAQGVQDKTKATAVEVQQTPSRLSPPMKELDALIMDGWVHHDGNPVLSWMIGNVTAHEDANENVFPRKDDPENKIDGASAAIMCISRLMVASPKRSIYATRGLLTLDAEAGGVA